MLEGLDHLAAEVDRGDVLVVAHAGIIYALEGTLGRPHERIPNLGGRWFTRDDAGWSLGERVSLLPDDAVVEIPDVL